MPRLAASCLLSLIGLAVPAIAQETAEDVIAEARADCALFDDGELTVSDDAVAEVELTGDDTPEQILDTQGLRCSTAASLYCGTGGCSIFVIAGGTAHKFLVKGWRVIEWGDDRILLTQVHGANCDGTNLRRCYEALVWSEDGFRTVRPPAP